MQWKPLITKLKGLAFFFFITDCLLYPISGYNELLVITDFNEKFLVSLSNNSKILIKNKSTVQIAALEKTE